MPVTAICAAHYLSALRADSGIGTCDVERTRSSSLGARAPDPGAYAANWPSTYDVPRLLSEWHWLVPETATPLFISALGDWVFGHPEKMLARRIIRSARSAIL
jgi:hypothetical protein